MYEYNNNCDDDDELHNDNIPDRIYLELPCGFRRRKTTGVFLSFYNYNPLLRRPRTTKFYPGRLEAQSPFAKVQIPRITCAPWPRRRGLSETHAAESCDQTTASYSTK